MRVCDWKKVVNGLYPRLTAWSRIERERVNNIDVASKKLGTRPAQVTP
jgi:hypothetical protein